MPKSSKPQQETARLARQLSPELAEFLHMLKSLEGQLADQPEPALR
jgi:hypothetical protein